MFDGKNMKYNTLTTFFYKNDMSQAKVECFANNAPFRNISKLRPMR